MLCALEGGNRFAGAASTGYILPFHIARAYSLQLPANVSFTFVLIWCDPYNVPVAEAPIPPTP